MLVHTLFNAQSWLWWPRMSNRNRFSNYIQHSCHAKPGNQQRHMTSNSEPITFTHKYETAIFIGSSFFFKTPGWAFSCFARKRPVLLVAGAGTKVVAVLCYGREHLLAPAEKHCKMLCVGSVFFSCAFTPCCLSLVAFNAVVFSWSCLLCFLGCCFRRFFVLFSPFPPALPVVKGLDM